MQHLKFDKNGYLENGIHEIDVETLEKYWVKAFPNWVHPKLSFCLEL